MVRASQSCGVPEPPGTVAATPPAWGSGIVGEPEQNGFDSTRNHLAAFDDVDGHYYRRD